jgi:hypothetical protein
MNNLSIVPVICFEVFAKLLLPPSLSNGDSYIENTEQMIQEIACCVSQANAGKEVN